MSADTSHPPDARPALLDDPEFKRRRVQNWMVLGLLYAFFYMSRYNYGATNAYLATLFGWDNKDTGVFETVLPLVYGLSVVLNGPIADRIGGKKAFLFGTLGVIVMNALFGAFSYSIATPAVWEGEGKERHVVTAAVLNWGLTKGTLLTSMVTVWAINGYFQSFGALSIVKVNAQWFTVRERGTFAGIFGVLIRFGLLLGSLGSPWLMNSFGWAWAYWGPSLALCVLFVMNYFLMEDSPDRAGFEPLDTGDSVDPNEKAGPLPVMDVLKKVFASRITWTIALASMMIGLVRRSVLDAWTSKYFVEVYHANAKAIGEFGPYKAAAWGMAIAGIAGGFAFGISSDRIFKGRRAPVIVYGFIGMAVFLTLFGLATRLQLNAYVNASMLILLSFFVNGAHGMIGGAASMDFGGKKAAATAAGLFDGMQYLAGAFTGVGVGAIVDAWGWSSGIWQWAPVPAAIVGALVMARLWNVTPRGRSAH